MKASERTGHILKEGYNISIPLPDAVTRRLSEAPALRDEALTGFMEERKAVVVGMTRELSEHALRRAQVQPLNGELRSCETCSTAKKKKEFLTLLSPVDLFACF